MAMVRCGAGLHSYDSSKHSICPQCGNGLFELGGEEMVNASKKSTTLRPTRLLDRNAKAQDAGTVYDEEFGKVKSDKGSSDPLSHPSETGGKTKVIRSKRGVRPVTGWFVVVEGPGKGTSLPLYHGVNYIGRSRHIGEGERQREQEVALNFGSLEGDSDNEISREDQARLTYDKRSNVFYLQHGGSNTLTYLNDQPVLELKRLSAYDRISMGSTILVFVPFCSEQFQWPED